MDFGGKILSDELFESGGYRFGTNDPNENERWIRIVNYGDVVYPVDGTDLVTFTHREMKALLDGKALRLGVGEYGLIIRYK